MFLKEVNIMLPTLNVDFLNCKTTIEKIMCNLDHSYCKKRIKLKFEKMREVIVKD
jgi:hypothetical protein